MSHSSLIACDRAEGSHVSVSSEFHYRSAGWIGTRYSEFFAANSLPIVLALPSYSYEPISIPSCQQPYGDLRLQVVHVEQQPLNIR
jgi:hypothetical protein